MIIMTCTNSFTLSLAFVQANRIPKKNHQRDGLLDITASRDRAFGRTPRRGEGYN